MTEETTNADSAGRERANASRPERVAHLRSKVIGLLRIATTAAEADQWIIADSLFTEAISLRKEIQRLQEGKPLREGQRGREAVHGEAAENEEIAIHPFHPTCVKVGCVVRFHVLGLYCLACGTEYIPYG
jgi:hypothetical protein